ncbi:hypothetical protein MTBBW1_830041 [Desulfamplus magnetovallimortis]|uniref:Uncharacterized protein n=1 Tax=Desulfamplus magnetovallimortis TaxID=1246637 RepID=A0A1W1HKH5_9BACT|nr:hypothetical protein MTBBW1_830041 [Desulfamplus magnetovallimortis]
MYALTFDNTRFNAFESVWGISEARAVTRGNPADKRVASCLVVTAISDGLILKKGMNALALSLFFCLEASVPISLIETGNICFCLNLERAEKTLSASIMPDVFFPDSLNALYSNTVICYVSFYFFHGNTVTEEGCSHCFILHKKLIYTKHVPCQSSLRPVSQPVKDAKISY